MQVSRCAGGQHRAAVGNNRHHGRADAGNFARMTNQLWDISPPVGVASPVFPGDQHFQLHWTARLGQDSAVNISCISLSPHIGAHADAPLHYDPTGAAIGALDLDPYLGPCRVVHCLDAAPLVQWSHPVILF